RVYRLTVTKLWVPWLTDCGGAPHDTLCGCSAPGFLRPAASCRRPSSLEAQLEAHTVSADVRPRYEPSSIHASRPCAIPFFLRQLVAMHEIGTGRRGSGIIPTRSTQARLTTRNSIKRLPGSHARQESHGL